MRAAQRATMADDGADGLCAELTELNRSLAGQLYYGEPSGDAVLHGALTRYVADHAPEVIECQVARQMRGMTPLEADACLRSFLRLSCERDRDLARLTVHYRLDRHGAGAFLPELIGMVHRINAMALVHAAVRDPTIAGLIASPLDDGLLGDLALRLVRHREADSQDEDRAASLFTKGDDHDDVDDERSLPVGTSRSL